MEFPNWVSKYVGIPFKDCNCYELLRKIYSQELGINLPSFSNEYKNAFDSKNIIEIFRRESKKWKSVKIPEEKDVVIINWFGQPFHIGIVIKKPWMLHTQFDIGQSVIERYELRKYKNKIAGFKRYKCSINSVTSL